uniref:Short chain dehydrogenase/reductase family 42E, member 2 n=1 Tax=Catagonus wagneri TaxID=51154 RepID=A0A8C3VLM8_9CETA
MKPSSAGSAPGACTAAGRAPQPKTQVTPMQAPRQKVLVTGGGGYLGSTLGSSLAKNGVSVILLDLRRPQQELCPGTEFIQADVRDAEALHRAFEGVDCVFHMASYGMSGAEKLQKEQIESINVGGTKLVIDACVRRRVPRLIYTSTVNVAFGGKPIEQGDEDSVPYFPLEKHVDHYSRTKAIADQLTLMANGTPLPGGGILRTCVLRPPGIYGPEEQRHLPRVAGHIKKRLFLFRFGDRRTRMNWVHVRNLAQAHMLAAEALTAAKGYVANGQAYYINDGESVNLFEWMAPLFEKLGYSQPWIQVPASWVYLSAAVMEYLHLALRPICSLPPLLTRSEVRSVAVTHTFRIAKARAQLGYAPDKFSFADAVDRYVQSTAGRTHSSAARAPLRLLLGLLLLGLLALALHFLGLQPSVA